MFVRLVLPSKEPSRIASERKAERGRRGLLALRAAGSPAQLPFWPAEALSMAALLWPNARCRDGALPLPCSAMNSSIW